MNVSPDPANPLKLLIVDDHQVVRMGLRLLEQDHSWIQVVGEAATAEEAIRLGEHLRPEAAILDIRLGESNGIDLCKRLKQVLPQLKVLILTSFLTDSLIIEAIEAGADGYLLKESAAEEILLALQTIRRGGIAMSPTISQRALRARIGPREAPEFRWVGDLNLQEISILRGVTEGLTNKEIADRLALSPLTVRNYLERVYLKMDVQRRSAAAVLFSRAVAGGLIPTDEKTTK